MPVTYVKQAPQAPLWASGFVTTTSTVPAAWAGVVAVMLVAFTTVTELAAAPPKLAETGATKPVPVMVAGASPAVEPLFGFTLVTVGAGTAPTKVKQPVHVAVCVSAFVTTTSTAPAAWAGVVALTCVALTTVTALAAPPPKLTVAGATKPAPVMVTRVPPAVAPLVGVTAVTIGVVGATLRSN